jgi:hypothetical protein
MATTSNWYKGNLHMHSFWSDGGHFPEVVAQRFKQAGYHFISFTEHDQHQAGERWVTTAPPDRKAMILQQGDLLRDYVDTLGDDWVEQRVNAAGVTEVRLKPLHEYRHLYEEPERFLMLTGEEITVSNAESTHWMNVYHGPQVIQPLTTKGSSRDAMRQIVDAGEAMARASDRPMVVSLNHPNYRYNATAEDIAATPGLRFMEIHTALSSCNSYGDALHAGAEHIWDIVLSLRLGTQNAGDRSALFGLVSDDCHSYHAHDTFNSNGHGEALPFRAWMMVRADRLTPDRIMRAIREGDYYGSSGVTLSQLTRGPRSLSLAVQPEPGVRYRIQFIGTRRSTDLAGTPVRDDNGQPIRATHRYSDRVGEVLREVEGTSARYDLTGDELYVRAVVISDRAHDNPHVPGDTLKAWTQPLIGEMAR